MYPKVYVQCSCSISACISGFTDDKSKEQSLAARKFKDIIAEAKKIANREYARTENGEVGIQKITEDKNKRKKTLLDLIEEYEVKMYARKLENMMKA